MAKAARSPRSPDQLTLSYQLIRNTTSPDESSTGVRSFVANLAAPEILKLDTEKNLRSYIPEYKVRKRTRVHDAIRETIDTDRQRFITRNSGFVVTAADIEVDDNKKVVKLTDASLINGAQSQGEIRRWIEDVDEDDADAEFDETPFFVRVEVIVDSDAQEVVETAIARNNATQVKSISQAGARGVLDDLQRSVKKRHPDLLIAKSETDEGFDTRKLLQYSRLLMPESVSGNATAAEKLRAYKNPEQCLTDFATWFSQKDSDEEARVKYEFTVQIAPYAIDEYRYWESHDDWRGQNIWEQTKKGGRVCRRDKNGSVVWVSPGLVFPVVGAMSEFVQQTTGGKWVVAKPSNFKPAIMLKQAVAQFRSLDSDPMQMGRSAGAYDALRIYTATLADIQRDMEDEKA